MRVYRIGERRGCLPAEVLRVMRDGVERTPQQVLRLLPARCKALQGRWRTRLAYYVNHVMRDMAARDQLRVVRRVKSTYPGAHRTPVYVIEQARGVLSSAALEQAWGTAPGQRVAA